MRISFVLLCEGSSDEPLVDILSRQLVAHGATEANGYADSRKKTRDHPATVTGRLRRLLDEHTCVDLVFVHRDADSDDPEERLREINAAVLGIPDLPLCVPVVPVQETEAWLLLDEQEIRRVAGNPRGRMDLHLPSPEHIEREPHPKERLQQALLDASGASGRRREQERKRFNEHRRILLQRLRTDGPVTQVPSWQRLEQDIDQVIRKRNWAI